MRDIVKPGIVLFIITAVVSLLLAVANVMTVDIIEQNRISAKGEAVSHVLHGDVPLSFSEDIATGNEDGVISYDIASAGSEEVGFVFTVTVKGYGGNMTILVGIWNDGSIGGIEIVEHHETPGLGSHATDKEFTDQFIGKSGKLTVTKGVANDSEIHAITASTITTDAVTRGVNLATEYFENVLSKGGGK